MPSFNQHINEVGQYIIGAKVILPSKQTDHEFRKANGYRALVDTGANCCSISEKIVSDLDLMPIGETQVVTAGEILTTYEYSVGIAVFVNEILSPPNRMDGDIRSKNTSSKETGAGLHEVKVTSFPYVGTHRGFDIILGMNILAMFHITIYRGTIIFSI